MKKMFLLSLITFFGLHASFACTSLFTFTVTPMAGHPHHVNFTFTNNASGLSEGVFYNINYGDGSAETITNSLTASHNYATGGTYRVKLVVTVTDTLSATTSCADSSTDYVATVGTGIVSSVRLSPVIFPNPAGGIINISGLSANQDKAHITITDIAGRIAYESDLTYSNSGDTQLSCDMLEDGLYFIKVNDGETNFGSQIKIEH